MEVLMVAEVEALLMVMALLVMVLKALLELYGVPEGLSQVVQEMFNVS
jgi:hypothetical protein